MGGFYCKLRQLLIMATLSLPAGMVLTTMLVNLGIAAYVFWKNFRSVVHAAFFLFVLGAAAVGISICLLVTTHNFIFDRMNFFGGATMLLGLILLAKTFPDKSGIEPRFFFLLIPLLAIYVGSPLNWFIKGMIVNPDGSIAPINAPGIYGFVAIVAFYLILILILFIKNYRRLAGVPKQQMQYLALGAGVLVFSIFIFNVLLPALGFAALNLVGPASSIIFVGLTGYAILRHRLLNISIVIRRSLGYAVLLAITTAIYFLSSVALGPFLMRGKTISAASFTISIIAGIAILPLVEKYFQRRLEERTAQLRQFQEWQKQTMVDISHGLQTPLTVVKSQLASLRKQIPDCPNLAALEKSIDEASYITYRLLELAKLEDASERFPTENVNLSCLLDDLAEYVGVLADAQNIAIETNIEPDVRIVGNRSRLEELVTNLVSNSIKYIRPDGEKKITISLKRSAGAAELAVQDTGEGIHPHDLPRVFERFYRCRNAKKTGNGTGLGLAIAKKIVEKHSGTIGIESELGRGTLVKITFPR